MKKKTPHLFIKIEWYTHVHTHTEYIPHSPYKVFFILQAQVVYERPES